MLTLPRIVLQPVEFIPLRSARFAFRFFFCLALTAFNAAVIAYSATALYRGPETNSFLFAGVVVLFAALLGSLVRVWACVLRPCFR